MDKSQNQFLTQHTENGVIVLTFTEPTLNADAVTEALMVVTAAENRKVILDCQSVRFLVAGSLCPDQEPFTPLLKLRKQLNEEGGRLVLCNASHDFADVLRIIRFDRIIEIRSDVNAAMVCLARPSETKTTEYSHTQKALLCLILYATALGCLVLAWTFGETPGAYIAGGVSLLIASLAPAFHYLTVVDLGDVLAIRFGPIPFFRRTVRYDDIVKVEVGRTLLLDGWGIHMSIRGGWVWNLWGRNCVVVHFKNDNRLFYYWGCSPTGGIWGVELNADNPMEVISQAKEMIPFRPEEFPWEAVGEWNQNPLRGWMEGAWMLKRNGVYYLTNCAGGTENRTYAMGCYVDGTRTRVIVLDWPKGIIPSIVEFTHLVRRSWSDDRSFRYESITT